MLDDWGDILGFKGSGSQSIVFEGGRIPATACSRRTSMINVDVGKGTPGVALHGNPMYGGRALGIFTMCLAAVMVGAAYNALDEYEAQMEARTTTMPPIVPRKLDPDFQRYFGAAWAKTPRRRLPSVTARSSTWSFAGARPRRASRSRTGTTCCWGASAAR